MGACPKGHPRINEQWNFCIGRWLTPRRYDPERTCEAKRLETLLPLFKPIFVYLFDNLAKNTWNQFFESFDVFRRRPLRKKDIDIAKSLGSHVGFIK
jgi:hypothetical protein